ncbi:transposase zinc-binding domain-containing protein [Archangium lansingense]|uniref:transposase zinc-binding domain-containing protein n=1 Tax=Archangium lansingense TaxID=2995310 RepID=UPI003B796D48
MHGFARVRCESCKDELLVAFSCKGRGVCPSCNAKRAQVTAVHLVERVLPHVPYPPIFRLGLASNPSLPCAGAGRRLRAGGGRRALRGVAAAHAR